MLSHLKNLLSSILDSPEWKSIISALFAILTAILSGGFITEITESGKLNWSKFYSTTTFYMLVVSVILLTWFNKKVYDREKAINKFADDSYCKAYMRSQCLPEAALKYKEIIKNGEIGGLEKAMDELNRVLK